MSGDIEKNPVRNIKYLKDCYNANAKKTKILSLKMSKQYAEKITITIF